MFTQDVGLRMRNLEQKSATDFCPFLGGTNFVWEIHPSWCFFCREVGWIMQLCLVLYTLITVLWGVFLRMRGILKWHILEALIYACPPVKNMTRKWLTNDHNFKPLLVWSCRTHPKRDLNITWFQKQILKKKQHQPSWFPIGKQKNKAWQLGFTDGWDAGRFLLVAPEKGTGLSDWKDGRPEKPTAGRLEIWTHPSTRWITSTCEREKLPWLNYPWISFWKILGKVFKKSPTHHLNKHHRCTKKHNCDHGSIVS